MGECSNTGHSTPPAHKKYCDYRPDIGTAPHLGKWMSLRGLPRVVDLHPVQVRWVDRQRFPMEETHDHQVEWWPSSMKKIFIGEVIRVRSASTFELWDNGLSSVANAATIFIHVFHRFEPNSFWILILCNKKILRSQLLLSNIVNNTTFSRSETDNDSLSFFAISTCSAPTYACKFISSLTTLHWSNASVCDMINLVSVDKKLWHLRA